MKKLKIIILSIIIFLAGFLIGNGIKYYLDMWHADRNVQAWQKGIDNLYANDTYGGKTPEETFDLYLAALKKGDLELASKYFWMERQNKELNFLQKVKNNDELQNYTNELNSIKKYSWKKNESGENLVIAYQGYREKPRTVEIFDTKWNIIEKKLPTGTFSSEIKFTKLNNIWKIDYL